MSDHKMKLEEEIKQQKFKNEFNKAMINIIYTSGWLNSVISKRLKPYDISIQQFNILRILRGQYPKPATILLIQKRMLDKMSNASRLVEKLRIKKMVERTTCPDDRRAVNIIITDRGLGVLKQIEESDESWEKQYNKLANIELIELNNLLDNFRS
jgi:DNA-binding MarR family transcriptional regulator